MTHTLTNYGSSLPLPQLTVTLGRRRKKSCIPHPANPSICTECFVRGAVCREQEAAKAPTKPYKDTNQNLQRRVTELENTLQSIAKSLGSTQKTAQPEQSSSTVLKQLRSDILPLTPALSAATAPDSGLDNAPVLSLFNNAILSRRQDDETAITMSARGAPRAIEEDPAAASKNEKIRQTLLSLFPSQQRLEAILDATYPWWASWQHMFPEIFGAGSHSTFNEFVVKTKATGNAPQLAKALLCISISLQETPINVDAKYNMSNAQDLTSQYMSVVDDLVLSNDELASTLDGIECMILQAKTDSNNGRVRRAWVTFRRGISFAQLLGLHLRPAAHSKQSKENIQRKQSIWKALYMCDRYMSLLLGLPYGVSDSHVNVIEPQRAEDDYLFRLSGVIGHIVDRNQTLSSNNTLTATVEIEGEMTELASTMPSSWWALDIRQEDLPAQLYTRILPQFWHHQTRTLLHLPFMLKATTDLRYSYNKIAALESARAMISLYRIFRPIQGFASLVCKIIDFQAFTAAMLLVLNFLGLSPSSCASELKDADDDRDLVSITTSILQRASLETRGGVATQAARALEMFNKAKDQGFPGSQGASKVAIPYFGTVVFGPGKSFVNQSHPPTPDSLNQQRLQQQPTPEEEPLATPNSNQDTWSFANDYASMPSDFNYNGFPLQQNQGVEADSDAFANVNLDLDGDWSWFWNNTDFSYGGAQL